MPKNKGKTVLVIGGGAAGMTAAIAARRMGAEVTILERNPRVGKKILATGNGRCNLTNTNLDISFFHGKRPEFIYGAISRFDYNMTIDFFEELGITHKVEEGGKVFPVSNQASSVLDVMRYELDELGVNVVCEAAAAQIEKKEGFKVTLEDGRVFNGDKVIVATGGKASPDLGSNGSGYKLVQKFGHKMIEPFPALVQLKLSAKFLKQIQGIKFDGDVAIVINDNVVRYERGEILFTEYGISGPPILQISRKAGEYLQRGEDVYIKVVIVNFLKRDELDELLVRRFSYGHNKPLSFNFVGFLNKKLIPVVLKEAGITDIDKPAGSVTADERRRICDILLNWRFKVTGTNPWSSAQVTAGGVDVGQIYGRTMESKLVPGLYLAGEIVDIDGDCGGYNLQWAWSSGFVAGESAAGAME